MRPPRPPSMGSDAPGLDGAREEPQQPSHPLAANHGRQESKTREAGVIVSFGGRPAGAAPAPARPRRLTTVLVVDKARLCCSLCSLALKRPIYQVRDAAPQYPTY